ncbi:Rv1453 family transcriptional regulator [Mycobacterium asiaticum]|uniref:Rv1453 family transcriptional regulator n=1 Tax=Mycobacterium asiaticum TaxID=1790 RepID=UPI001C12AF8E|nr:PucR family transcriptional regulator [Mycobacterium asiaticum]
MVDSRLAPQTRELIRQGAWIALNPSPEWLAELDRATVAANPALAGDPTLAVAVSSSNRATLVHFATSHLRDPGAPVTAYLGPEPLRMARVLVRRGLGASVHDVFRIGQNVALQRWMDIVFDLTSTPHELHELLNLVAKSASDFVDATLAGITRQMKLEHTELAQGALIERRKIVEFILARESMNHKRAEARLGYSLAGSHTAAVIWCDESDDEYRMLDRTTAAVCHAVGSAQPLTVLAAEATRWVWFKDVSDIDSDQVRPVLDETPKLRIAIGTSARGVEGFRRSHQQALAAQHMMVRLRSRQQVAFFDDVQMVALLTQKPDYADDFITSTLGAFASAGSVLRDTLLTYINEQCNAARAAQQLYIHRNTLLSRLDTAQRLLPRPLDRTTVRVAVALEALKWSGSQEQDLSNDTLA